MKNGEKGKAENKAIVQIVSRRMDLAVEVEQKELDGLPHSAIGDLQNNIVGDRLLTALDAKRFVGFVDAFDYSDVPRRVRIDISAAHFWDIAAIGALDDIVLKLRRHGATVEVIGLNEASATLVERFATHHRADLSRPSSH